MSITRIQSIVIINGRLRLFRNEVERISYPFLQSADGTIAFWANAQSKHIAYRDEERYMTILGFHAISI